MLGEIVSGANQHRGAQTLSSKAFFLSLPTMQRSFNLYVFHDAHGLSLSSPSSRPVVPSYHRPVRVFTRLEIAIFCRTLTRTPSYLCKLVLQG